VPIKVSEVGIDPKVTALVRIVIDPRIHPEWPFGFDMDVPLATKSRMAFLNRAAADKTLVGSYARGAATAGCRQIGSGRADDFAGRGRCAPPPAS